MLSVKSVSSGFSDLKESYYFLERLFIKRFHRSKPIDQEIFNILLSKGDMVRDEIVEKTSYPRTTIYDALGRLIKNNLVSSYPLKVIGKRGRPPVWFAIS